jgi:predicted transcriptional regulator
MDISFALSEWSGWKSKALKNISKEKDFLNIGKDPDVSSIPPLLRRRLNLLGRACANEILQHVKKDENIPVVYCSQHGDIERTFGILTGAAKGEPISPMNFSLSVHNAILGVLSIHLGLTSSISSISSDQNGLVPVLLEAVGILMSGSEKVLCVICDVTLPQIYLDDLSLPRNSYAISFIVTKSEGTSLKLIQTEEEVNMKKNEELPTALIKFLSSDRKEIYLNHNGLKWKLVRR